MKKAVAEGTPPGSEPGANGEAPETPEAIGNTQKTRSQPNSPLSMTDVFECAVQSDTESSLDEEFIGEFAIPRSWGGPKETRANTSAKQSGSLSEILQKAGQGKAAVSVARGWGAAVSAVRGRGLPRVGTKRPAAAPVAARAPKRGAKAKASAEDCD